MWKKWFAADVILPFDFELPYPLLCEIDEYCRMKVRLMKSGGSLIEEWPITTLQCPITTVITTLLWSARRLRAITWRTTSATEGVELTTAPISRFVEWPEKVPQGWWPAQRGRERTTSAGENETLFQMVFATCQRGRERNDESLFQRKAYRPNYGLVCHLDSGLGCNARLFYVKLDLGASSVTN